MWVEVSKAAVKTMDWICVSDCHCLMGVECIYFLNQWTKRCIVSRLGWGSGAYLLQCISWLCSLKICSCGSSTLSKLQHPYLLNEMIKLKLSAGCVPGTVLSAFLPLTSVTYTQISLGGIYFIPLNKRRGNWGIEYWRHLPRIPQLGKGRGRIWTHSLLC